MAEYVYILSNPRMRGLIKVGKTTKLPTQRMDELHSTGVPAPFELECAFEVDDCSAREKAAHAALAKYRVERREFFEIGVESALQKILPVLGNYTIFRVKNHYAIEELARKVKQQEVATQRRTEKLKEETDKRQRIVSQEQEIRRREADIERRLLSEESDIQNWYRQEYARKFPDISLFIYSLPFAIVAFMILGSVFEKLATVGLFAIAGLVGWIGGNVFKTLHDVVRVNSVERQTLNDEFASKLKAVRHVCCSCLHCGQQLRIKRAQLIENQSNGGWVWNCPNCKTALIDNNFDSRQMPLRQDHLIFK